MSKYVIEDTTLTAIGDAIRGKNGTTDPIPVTGLATAITELPSGGGGGNWEYVQITNSNGVAKTQPFDASAYIGTSDTTPFYLILYSCYGATSRGDIVSLPTIVYYDGAGGLTYKLANTTNTSHISYKMKIAQSSVVGGVITISGGSNYIKFSTDAGTTDKTNYAVLIYPVVG